jgi:NMD protein affecting ribosome stability and mRNA decay
VNSKKRTILTACLLQIVAMSGTVLAQTQSVTTTVTTKNAPLTRPVSTTTTTTVVKKRSPHLKRRKGKTARKTSRVKTTTVVRTNSALSGSVAKTHKHHHVHVRSTEKSSGTQQTRSNKLNAFLKNPPKMKKAPYFNPPGLDVPSSPAL